ncbi:hypothetical protein CPB85DRAFT_364837 [Mucidula mucida]|nr:hypothetical protein CPB85DRAFT_364837 [Mucidula mucida]
MKTFGPLWVIRWPHDWLWPRWCTLSAYISGLVSASMASCRQEYIDHLHEPDNLAIAMCVLSEDLESLQSLIELNPTHPSWERCRGIMEAIVAWNASPNCETTEFPVDLVRGMSVHCPDQSIHLAKPLRTRFMGRR